MKIKKNDQIVIIKGKDRGKTGKVERVILKKNLLIVSGVNIGKKHLKPNQKNPHGGIVNFNAPMAIANVSLICPRCNKATRINYQNTERVKLRICKKCRESIDSR